MLLAALGGFFKRGDNQANADILALQAQSGDQQAMEDLMISYSPFLKKTAAQVCKRFIDDHDDEYSIALSAFQEAVEGFDKDRNASFLTFAHMVVRRRIIDFIRKENRLHETSHDFSGDRSEGDGKIELTASYERYTEQLQTEKRREEIKQFETILHDFDLSFQILVKVSPAHEDARVTAIQIAQLVAETEEYKEFLLAKKKLPVKEIERLVKVSRKTIERNRKYIIAVALLLMTDLHYLKDYLKERLR